MLEGQNLHIKCSFELSNMSRWDQKRTSRERAGENNYYLGSYPTHWEQKGTNRERAGENNYYLVSYSTHWE